MSLKDRIDKVVEERLDIYKYIALKIHEKPEVSNHEYFACNILSDQLKKEGFEVRVDVAGHPTGFDARYKSSKPGPVVVFFAEYDALGGIGHACGHNLFGATSSLAAVGLKAVMMKWVGRLGYTGPQGKKGEKTAVPRPAS